MSTLDLETAGRFDLLARPVNRDATLRHYGALIDTVGGSTYSVQLWPWRNEHIIFRDPVAHVIGAGANPDTTMGVTVSNLDTRKALGSHYVVGGREIVKIFPYDRLIKPSEDVPFIDEVKLAEARHVATLAEYAFALSTTPKRSQL